MALSRFENNVAVADHQLSFRDLQFVIDITANATPANKVHSSELPGVAVLRTEGKTAEADAVEDLSASFTTAADNDSGDSQFGLILKGSELGAIERVYEVELTDLAGNATSLAVTPASSDYLTAGGNIALDIAGTGLNLASESAEILVKVKYKRDI